MSVQRMTSRSANGLTKFCNECHEEKRKGYWMFWQEVSQEAVFLCDDCMDKAEKV